VEVLKRSEPFADIFLPDFKYSDPLLSARLSKCKAYPKAALEAIAEMIRQKGFLDALPGDSALASKGVLVRHLILPGEPNNSTDALTSLFLEFGPELPLSLMSQYQPVIPQPDPHFNRPISKGEFEEVYSHALSLGFENIFVQFPDKQGMERANASPFLPDFRKAHPFG
jgi:putative pyruvate formate lyase activating enzyme